MKQPILAVMAIMILSSCIKEDDCELLLNEVTIEHEIEPKGSYQYGYVGKGQPNYSVDPTTGECTGVRYTFELYSDIQYKPGQIVTGALSKSDSLSY